MRHIPPSKIAACLALMALVPLVVSAICLWFVAPEWQPGFARFMTAYGAVALGFSGGLHWDGPNLWRYVYGIMPALLACVVFLCPPALGLFLLFLGFITAFYIDRRIYTGGAIVIRAVITGIITVSLFAAYKAL